jgi:hypothetical protein
MADLIARASQQVSIVFAEHIQIPIPKIAQRPQHLRRFAVEHLPESAQTGRQ